VKPAVDYQGAIEIRLLSRPFASTEFSGSERLGAGLLDDDVMAVSYIPIEGPNDPTPSRTRLTPGVQVMEETLARLEAAGLSTDYVFRGGSFDSIEAGPTSLIWIPGTERVIGHAIEHAVKGVIWVYNKVSPAVEAGAAVKKNVELIEKVSKELRSDSDRSVAGGALEDASKTARRALAEALECESDNSTLSFTQGGEGQEPGVFVCVFGREQQGYRVTVVYRGEGAYAVRSIDKVDRGSEPSS
jgi:hypothetical protein